MMAEPKREWLPEAFMDEVVCTTKEDPSEFLQIGPDRTFFIQDEEHILPVSPDEIVKFCPYDDAGTIIVVVDKDGDIAWAEDVPPGNWSFTVDNEWIADNLDELVKGDGDNPALTQGRHDVEVYRWGDAVPFRLDVGADRVGLVRCDQ